MATKEEDNKLECVPNVNKDHEKCFLTVYKKYEYILNNKNETFENKIGSLIEVWKNIGELDLSEFDIRHVVQIMDWAKLHALNIVLTAEWNKYKDKYQEKLLDEIEKAQNELLKLNSVFATPCKKLADVVRNPWEDHTLMKLMKEKDIEIGSDEIEFFCVETAYLVSVRLKKLCESQCEDLALNLVTAFMKCNKLSGIQNFNLNATETQMWFIFDIYIALLYKFQEKQKIVVLLKELTFDEGLQLVKRFAKKRVKISKIWKNCHRIAILATQMYISQAVVKYSNELQGTLESYLEMYISLCNTDSVLQDFSTSIRRISNLADAPGLYIFCDVIQKKAGSKLKPFIIEMYIRALTTDMNELERMKDSNETEKVELITQRLAKAFINLADFLDEHVKVARECVLTAFSLAPTSERLQKIEDLAKRSGFQVLDTGQEWKCRLHPPVLPSDEITWICPECGDWMCKPTLNLPKINMALHEALQNSVLGISEALCDDLVVCLSNPRYQILSWFLPWNDLHRLCIMYLQDPQTTKNFVTELKFVDIDYSIFKDIKREPLDELAGIERGYEQYLDQNFVSDGESISNSEDSMSQDSRPYSLGSDGAGDSLFFPLLPTPQQAKSDPNTLKSLRMFRPNLKRVRDKEIGEGTPEKISKLNKPVTDAIPAMKTDPTMSLDISKSSSTTQSTDDSKNVKTATLPLLGGQVAKTEVTSIQVNQQITVTDLQQISSAIPAPQTSQPHQHSPTLECHKQSVDSNIQEAIKQILKPGLQSKHSSTGSEGNNNLNHNNGNHQTKLVIRTPSKVNSSYQVEMEDPRKDQSLPVSSPSVEQKRNWDSPRISSPNTQENNSENSQPEMTKSEEAICQPVPTSTQATCQTQNPQCSNLLLTTQLPTQTKQSESETEQKVNICPVSKQSESCKLLDINPSQPNKQLTLRIPLFKIDETLMYQAKRQSWLSQNRSGKTAETSTQSLQEQSEANHQQSISKPVIQLNKTVGTKIQQLKLDSVQMPKISIHQEKGISKPSSIQSETNTSILQPRKESEEEMKKCQNQPLQPQSAISAQQGRRQEERKYPLDSCKSLTILLENKILTKPHNTISAKTSKTSTCQSKKQSKQEQNCKLKSQLDGEMTTSNTQTKTEQTSTRQTKSKAPQVEDTSICRQERPSQDIQPIKTDRIDVPQPVRQSEHTSKTATKSSRTIPPLDPILDTNKSTILHSTQVAQEQKSREVVRLDNIQTSCPRSIEQSEGNKKSNIIQVRDVGSQSPPTCLVKTNVRPNCYFTRSRNGQQLRKNAGPNPKFAIIRSPPVCLFYPRSYGGSLPSVLSHLAQEEKTKPCAVTEEQPSPSGRYSSRLRGNVLTIRMDRAQESMLQKAVRRRKSNAVPANGCRLPARRRSNSVPNQKRKRTKDKRKRNMRSIGRRTTKNMKDPDSDSDEDYNEKPWFNISPILDDVETRRSGTLSRIKYVAGVAASRFYHSNMVIDLTEDEPTTNAPWEVKTDVGKPSADNFQSVSTVANEKLNFEGIFKKVDDELPKNFNLTEGIHTYSKKAKENKISSKDCNNLIIDNADSVGKELKIDLLRLSLNEINKLISKDEMNNDEKNEQKSTLIDRENNNGAQNVPLVDSREKVRTDENSCCDPDLKFLDKSPRILLERMHVNKILAKSVLANVPGLNDYQMMKPRNVDQIVNVVQVSGTKTQMQPVQNTQTSTPVTPHIQRIGQPRPSDQKSDNSTVTTNSIAAVMATSNSVTDTAKNPPSTLINILSQQIIRPSLSQGPSTGNSNRHSGGAVTTYSGNSIVTTTNNSTGGTATVARRPPFINILSQQIIRPPQGLKVSSNNGAAYPINETIFPKSATNEPVISPVNVTRPTTTTTTVIPKLTSTTVTATAGNTTANPTGNASGGTIVQFICKSALPKFQQAFGKTVYQCTESNTEQIAVTDTNRSAAATICTIPTIANDVKKEGTTIPKAVPVNVQSIQGNVIYSRQVPVGQTINLMPPAGGTTRQVFRIAASNPEQLNLMKDSVIHSKMGALLAAALQSRPKNAEGEIQLQEDGTKITLTRPALVQNARIVKPVQLQIPANVVRAPQPNLSSTTLEQLREFDMVYKQIKERSSNTTPTEITGGEQSHESQPQRISVTYVNQLPKYTQLSPVVVVSSYSNLQQPSASPALSVTSQSSSSPCATPTSTPTVTSKVNTKTGKVSGKSVKNHANNSAVKTSPISKPQQKPQEDEHTTQRIFDILAEYAEQLRNSPDLNNKPAPRRRSNPPTNPGQNSKRKKSSSSKKSGAASSTVDIDTADDMTVGSEDSSGGMAHLSATDDEQSQAAVATTVESSTDNTVGPPIACQRQPVILNESASPQQPRNVIIADSSVSEALKMSNTAVIVPGSYIMPVSMVKGGQQIAVMSGGSKILATVPARSGQNMLLFQSFTNQNRKGSVSAVKYSALQSVSGISSQSIAGVSAQPPVILPSNSVATAVLGQQLTLKKIGDERDRGEMVLTISQKDDIQPDSSTSLSNDSDDVKFNESAGKVEHSNDKVLHTYQKVLSTNSPGATVIAAAVSSRKPEEEHGTAATVINKVTNASINGPMLSHITTARYRKTVETVRYIHREAAENKEELTHNGAKVSSSEQKPHRTSTIYYTNRAKRTNVDAQKPESDAQKQASLERELRLQKSLSEECEDLGVDEPSTSDLFPEADLLFDSNHSPSFDQSSQDVLKKGIEKEEEVKSSINIFSDDDNSSSLRSDLFDYVEYHTVESALDYQAKQLMNGNNPETESSSCEDNTLLPKCTNMSEVTLNSPISPEMYPESSINKYKFKYSNRKKSEKVKQSDVVGETVTISEDVLNNAEEGYKLVHVSVAKTDFGREENRCELHCDEFVDSPSGRGARRSVRKLCSCCNGTQEGHNMSRKRPNLSRPQTPATPHKKPFVKKR